MLPVTFPREFLMYKDLSHPEEFQRFYGLFGFPCLHHPTQKRYTAVRQDISY